MKQKGIQWKADLRRIAHVRDTLIGLKIDLADVDQQERHSLDRRWLAAFASRVKSEHSVAVYRGFRWHGFSHRIQPCVQGVEALTEYLRQGQAPFYVFDERLSFCALCSASLYPDLSNLHDDLYVTHHNMKWTMSFTHEQPHIGPFFAARDRDG